MNAITQIRRNDQPIYLDYQATTPMDPRVLEAMMPYFTDKFGNPSSRSHAYGWEAEEGVEKARAQIARLIGADRARSIFTSGATESNNLAIKGVAEFYKDARQPYRHHGDRAQMRARYLPPSRAAKASRSPICRCSRTVSSISTGCASAVTDKTVLVSVMAANNEIGVIQPLAEIGEICREKGASSIPTRRRRSARSRSMSRR